MPKIKNWTRRQRNEGPQQVLMWVHDEKKLSAKVLKRGEGDYDVLVKDRPTNRVEYSVEGFNTKEDARSNLTGWLKRHPNG